MKIYLIGMPLSGKSTIGKELSNKLSFEFIDLDNYIEEIYKVSIDEMLENGHEDFFRSLEEDALALCLKKYDTIIATGGGIVLNEKNNKLMEGLVVFLDIPLNVLKEREKTAKKRPLLKDSGALEKTYNERIELYYDFADIIVTETDIDKTVNTIINILEEEGYL